MDFSKKVKLIAALKKVVASHHIQAFTVNTDYEVCYLAGYSEDGNTIYIDRRLPRFFTLKDGRQIDVYKYLIVHERWEKLAEDGKIEITRKQRKDFLEWVWKFSGKPREENGGYKYPFAHELATGKEREAVEKDGIDWNEYQNYMLQEVKKLKIFSESPPDLDTKPEKDTHDYYRYHKIERLKKETAQAAPQASWEEMANWFERRTSGHIALVQKYIQKILKLNLPEIDGALLALEMDHDTGKWQEPEYTPYVYTTWRYKNPEYIIPPEVAIKAHESTFHHIKFHKHHPEYWDATVTKECVNPKNRDKPNNAPSIIDCLRCRGSGCRCGGRCQACRDHDAGLHANALVNATGMPLTYIGSLMADWLAMSEEKKTDVNDWIKNNVNVRWEFTPTQVRLMSKIVGLIGGDR